MWAPVVAVVLETFADGLALEIADELIADLLGVFECDRDGIDGSTGIVEVELAVSDIRFDVV